MKTAEDAYHIVQKHMDNLEKRADGYRKLYLYEKELETRFILSHLLDISKEIYEKLLQPTGPISSGGIIVDEKDDATEPPWTAGHNPNL